VACGRTVVFLGTLISSTNKTDRLDIAVILLKVTLKTINLNLNPLALWFLSLFVASKISFKEIIWSASDKYFILFSIPFNLFHISEYRLLGFTFDDTKGVIRIIISKKNRQHNGQKKKVQKDKQRSTKHTKHTYKTNDRVTRTPLKTGGELLH
jgi:hypothetical protein